MISSNKPIRQEAFKKELEIAQSLRMTTEHAIDK
jgi:hypothetical protein